MKHLIRTYEQQTRDAQVALMYAQAATKPDPFAVAGYFILGLVATIFIFHCLLS